MFETVREIYKTEIDGYDIRIESRFGCISSRIIGYITLPHNHKLRSKHIERFKTMSNVDIKMEDNIVSILLENNPHKENEIMDDLKIEHIYQMLHILDNLIRYNKG